MEKTNCGLGKVKNAFCNFAAEIMQLPSLLLSSAREMKNVRALVGAAMLAALNIVIAQFEIPVGPYVKISFSFLTYGVSGMLFGPLTTGVVGIAADLIKYMVSPDGGFHPGFTLNEFVIGFLYGICLYRKKVTVVRSFVTKLVTVFIINLFLTPLWLAQLYGEAYQFMVSARLIKNAVMLPIDTALLFFVLTFVQKTQKLLYH